MPPNVYNLGTVLGLFIPGTLPLQQGFDILATLAGVTPIFRLHRNQHRERRQPAKTAWMTSIASLITSHWQDPIEDLFHENPELHHQAQVSEDITDNLEHIYDLLGIDLEDQHTTNLFPKSPLILVTPRLICPQCPADDLYTLRRRVGLQTVRVLDSSFQWQKGILLIGHCPNCRSDFYPDRYTYMVGNTRYQRLEYDTTYLRISKSGIWAHRSVAYAQENAINRFHSAWSNFASWINDGLTSKPNITNRQSQRLFLEHFARRLLIAHEKSEEFLCIANLNSSDFAESLREVIGVDGGRLPGSIHHGCIECTHKKRYQTDLIEEGANLDAGNNAAVAGIIDDGNHGGQV